MPSTKKVATVDRLTKQLQENQNIVFLGFEATSHTALESLRRALRAVNASVSVVKTSLIGKAVENVADLEPFKQKALPVKNSTAVVSALGDWSAALKAIADFAKKETSVAFKIGFLDKVVYDMASLKALSQLPSRMELLGKIVGSFKSPISRVDYAVKFPMTYFVQVLKAKAAQG